MARLHRASGPSAVRHSSTTPAPNNPAATASASTSTSTSASSLPYKPPSHALNAAGQRSLDALQHAHKLAGVKDRYRRAAELVTDSASVINERHALRLERQAREERRKRQERERRRERSKGKGVEKDGDGGEEDDDGNDDDGGNGVDSAAAEETRQLTTHVDELTQRMDESIRRIIDGQVAVVAMEHSLRTVQNRVATDVQLRATLESQSQAQAHARQRRGADNDGDENNSEDHDMSDADATDNNDSTNGKITIIPQETFRKELATSTERYNGMSLGARYSENNDYIGFRQSVHDARHGDEGPPLPHASTWFSGANGTAGAGSGKRSNQGASQQSSSGGRNEREFNSDTASSTTLGKKDGTGRGNGHGRDEDGNDDDDDDIAIARERISTRCPLTLCDFVDPVTSRNCPHTFEKAAIMSLISSSTEPQGRGGGGGGGGGRNMPKQVKCPVPGCYEMLKATDLHPDPVLNRKIRRIQQSRMRAASEEEEDEAAAAAADGHEAVDRTSMVIPSDVTEDIDGGGRGFKREGGGALKEGVMVGIAGGSVGAGSRVRRHESVVVDLEGSDDDEEEEEEEDEGQGRVGGRSEGGEEEDEEEEEEEGGEADGSETEGEEDEEEGEEEAGSGSDMEL